MPQQVKILNPAPGHHGWTSAKNAIKMLKRGTARIEGVAIRLIETDYRFNTEALPRKAVVNPPTLPEISTFVSCWLNAGDGAAVAWPWVESRGVPLALDGRAA